MTTSNPKKQRSPLSERRLSMAAENYLLSIFQLQEQGARVTLTQLAEHLRALPEGEGLGTSLPSVGGMVRRLVREGLAETTANKDVVLTKRGLRSAESIVPTPPPRRANGGRSLGPGAAQVSRGGPSGSSTRLRPSWRRR